MEAKTENYRLIGKGLVVISPKDGIPGMRVLVGIYTDTRKNKYIKLDDQYTELKPSHMLI